MTQAREKEGEKTRGVGILAREAKPEARGGESWAGQEDARRAPGGPEALIELRERETARSRNGNGMFRTAECVWMDTAREGGGKDTGHIEHRLEEQGS